MYTSIAVRRILYSLAILAAATALRAQTPEETVYFTAPNNKILKVTSFAPGTSSTVVTDKGTNFKGLVAASEGPNAADTRIIVANITHGGDIRAYTGAGGKLGVIGSLKAANAVAIDAGRNVWAVNADQGGPDRLIKIPRVEGGYGAASGWSVPSVTLLADVKFVSSAKDGAAYQAGDVLVLAAKPAKILRFRANAFTTLASDFGGTEPAGMAIAPDGQILVTTLQGRILVFNIDGTRQSADFASLGKKGGQIAVGLQGGVPHVFATVTNGGAVRRYALGYVDSKLKGTPQGSVSSNVPFGVGNASLTGVAYTPFSLTKVTVLPVTGHEITFEKVKVAGVTKGNLYRVAEAFVRGSEENEACDEGESLTLEGVTRCVPHHVRGFTLDSDGEECNDITYEHCYFLVFVTDTGANVFGSTQQHHFEEHDFGFDTVCYTGGDPHEKQPRTFQATDADDPKIVEGDDFVDISTGCNSHIGRGGEFSMFLTGWDNRSTMTIARDKLNKLSLALNGTDTDHGGLAPYITSDLLGDVSIPGTLAYELRQAQLALLSNPSLAVTKLDAFIALVKNNLGEFDECLPGDLSCRNAPGELVARAESAAFLVCGAKQSCQRTLP
jgi:hypothetical protein